jgi:Domain of unknown function (DUF2341).
LLLGQIFYPMAFASVVYGPETFESDGSGQATFQRYFDLNDTSDLYQLFVRNNLGVNASNVSILLNGEGVLTGEELLESLVGKNVSPGLNNSLQFLMNTSLFSSYTAWIEDGTPSIRIISPTTDTVSNGSILLAGFVQDLNETYPVSLENSSGSEYTVPGPRDVTIDVNGDVSVVQAENGYFSSTLNLSSVNTIHVSFVDATGTLRATSLLLDGDYLNQSEESALGFDPLCADSDSSLTVANEGGNGVLDGLEYFVGDASDSLPVFVKSRLGADPFSLDSDSDGLSDYYEVLNLIPFATPSSGDTDGNGVPDGLEDFDDDSLSNLQELSLGSKPLNPDSDGDGLNDGLEVSLGSNLLSKDSDGDLLLDDSEYRLGTNITNPDSDSNGVWDGLESYVSVKSDDEVGVSLSVLGIGDVARNASIYNESSMFYISHPALISPVVNVSMPGSDETRIGFSIDQSNLTLIGLDVDPSLMMVGHYNDSLGLYLPLDTTVEVFDGESPRYVVSATANAPGLYACFNASNYSQAFRNVLESNYGTLNVANSINVTLNPYVNITVVNQSGASEMMSMARSLDSMVVMDSESGSTGQFAIFEQPRQMSNPVLTMGYAHAKSHVISGSADGALSDYQVKFVVHRGNGVDSGQDVYLNGASQAWPYDFRFTDSDYNLLNYWVESSDSDKAVVWIRVPSIPAGPGFVTVYLYYGKANDGGASNASGTFEFFDDFNSAANWNVNYPSCVLISNGLLQMKYFAKDKPWLSYCNGYITSKGKYSPNNYAIRMNAKQKAYNDNLYPAGWYSYSSSDGSGNWYSFEGYSFSINPVGGTRGYQVREDPPGVPRAQTTFNDTGLLSDTWNVFEMKKTSPTTLSVVRNDNVAYDSSCSDRPSALFNIGFGAWDSQNSYNYYVDWVLLRKYTRNEPTHTTWTTQTQSQLPNPAPSQFEQDSDNDGLPDHVELEGFLDEHGVRHYTNASDMDTDGDGLLDNEEVQYVAIDGYNSGTYKLISYPDREDSDGDSLWDDEEYYLGTGPLSVDSDGDKLNDDIDPNPLVFDVPEVEPSELEVVGIILKGAIFGEMGDEGGWMHFMVGGDSNSAYYLLGAIIGGFIPISDLRDLFQSIVNLDLLGSLLNAVGFIPGPGDAVKVTGTIGVFMVKHADDAKWMDDVIQVISKNILKYTPESIDEPVLNILTNNKAYKLRSLGYSWDEVVDIGAKNSKRMNIFDLAEYVNRLELHGVSSNVVKKLIDKNVYLERVCAEIDYLDNNAYINWADGPGHDEWAHLYAKYEKHWEELGFTHTNIQEEVLQYNNMAVDLIQKDAGVEIYYSTGHKTINVFEPSTGRYVGGNEWGEIATLHTRTPDELTEIDGFIRIR